MDSGHLVEARRLMQRGLAMARDLGDQRLLAWTMEGLAWVLAAEGQAEPAANLLGLATGAPVRMYPPDLERRERCRAAIRGQLDEDAFQAAYDRGLRLDWSQGLELALGEAAPGEAAPRPRPVRNPAGSPLTNREKQVVELAARGLTSRAIADHLGISVRTAENHVNRVLAKLSLRTRSELASGPAALGSGRG
jgi:DNA-binding CsgD family transcriptional regulator